MSQGFTPKIVTANDLLTGDVVYLTADGGWTRNHAGSGLLTDKALAQARLKQANANAHTVGAYLADALPAPNGPRPVHFREVFRATGPSNYAHTNQEGTKNV